jgi:cytoskeletal protein CcmA (bactofilin family)
MLSWFFFEPYKITINRYTLLREKFMNSRFSKKKVLLYSGLLAFAMSSAYAGDPPLTFANNYVSIGAGAYVNGDIQANNYVTTGANAIVTGHIQTGAAATLGASANVGGYIHADTAVTLGAHANVGGYIRAVTAVTLGAHANVDSTVNDGVPLTMGVGSMIGEAYLDDTPIVTFDNEAVFDARKVYSDMGSGGPLAPTITTSKVFGPGVYSAASLATTAGITITLDGTGTGKTDHWVFNITDILSFGANTKIELIKTGPNSRIIWNSGGYTSIGAGAQIKGTILAHTYVSTGEGSTVSGVPGVGVEGVSSCGGIYSETSYVSIGAHSEVGTVGCETRSIDLVEELAIGEADGLPSEAPQDEVVDEPMFGFLSGFQGLQMM